VHLELGELYAATRGAEEPLRVVCPGFSLELLAGDCFVSQEAAPGERAVLVVFNGRARVSCPGAQPFSLSSGQACYRVLTADGALTQCVDLKDLPDAWNGLPGERLSAEARAKLDGYRAELVRLRAEFARISARAPGNFCLAENLQSIQEELEEQGRLLRPLAPARPHDGVPLDQIHRGVRGRRDPKTWM
jgi:hypothetical protein